MRSGLLKFMLENFCRMMTWVFCHSSSATLSHSKPSLASLQSYPSIIIYSSYPPPPKALQCPRHPLQQLPKSPYFPQKSVSTFLTIYSLQSPEPMVPVLPALPEIGEWKAVSNVVVDHNFLLLFCFYFSAF